MIVPSPRCVIAGLKGGSGKTIVTLSLILALKQQGLTVSPFKKGPDYIDAGWLAYMAGQPCYNLDLFLLEKEAVLQSYVKHSGPDKLSVIEGNRGLYDGTDLSGTNSTAELAKILHSPVVLVLDCTKVTRTLAAIVKGLQSFDEQIVIGGVILNNIAGARHEAVVTQSIYHHCGLPVFGVVPRLAEGMVPERHMGLAPYQEYKEREAAKTTLLSIANHIDVNSIVHLAQKAPPLSAPELLTVGTEPTDTAPNIGILMDSAFQFYYPENIEELKHHGAVILSVSSLSMEELPQVDSLYIGGGFPETHAYMLAENKRFRQSLRDAIESGLPVYAECGGLMYLGQKLILDDKTYPMCGVLPVSFQMNKQPQAHGYTIVEVVQDNPYFKNGLTLKGHEFHYSSVVDLNSDQAAFAFSVRRGKGIRDKKDGLLYKNVFATYTHLHATGSPEWAESMVRMAKSRIQSAH